MARLKIHYQILIPYVLMSIAGVVVIGIVSYLVIARAVDARVQQQIDRASSLFADGDFLPSEPLLQRLKAVVGADLIVFDQNGGVRASTIETERAALLAMVRGLRPATGASPAGAVVATTDATLDGRDYRIGFRALGSDGGMTIAVIADVQDAAAMLQAIARAIVITGGVMLVLMIFTSQLVARRLTRRILEVAEFARRFGRGEAPPAPRGGDDEVGELGTAFADMAGQLRESEAKLLKSEKLAVAGLLAARVAHDVRNPLASLKMQAQLLQQRLATNTVAQEALVPILRDVTQVETVIKGLLEVARPGEVRLRQADVNVVLEEVLRHMAPQLTHRKVRVDTQLARQLPAIPLDTERFQLALVNLIANAADAMPAGGRLAVSTSLTADRGAIAIHIDDEGTGIPAELRPRLFEPFTSTKDEGVGLGLVNARSIVERHQGTIVLSDREGGPGTQARITLPIQTHG
jgi:signal transduction histidine kinase